MVPPVDVAGIGTAREKCFTASYLRVQDGRPLAFTEACPIHGNDCEFARRLFKFGSQLSRILASPRPKDGEGDCSGKSRRSVGNGRFVRGIGGNCPGRKGGEDSVGITGGQI